MTVVLWALINECTACTHPTAHCSFPPPKVLGNTVVIQLIEPDLEVVELCVCGAIRDRDRASALVIVLLHVIGLTVSP